MSYNISLNKNEIYGTHGTMKLDYGGLIRGLQQPRDNVFNVERRSAT